MPDASYKGPRFTRVEEISWEELSRQGGFGPRMLPFLVKGAVHQWPARERWTFQCLAELRRADGSEVTFRFQNGLVEQGVTRPPLDLPISPYIRQLAESASQRASGEAGLLPEAEWKQIAFAEHFHLHWSHMDSFKADRVYLAQWNILEEFPAMRNDFAIRSLWPGWRWT